MVSDGCRLSWPDGRRVWRKERSRPRPQPVWGVGAGAPHIGGSRGSSPRASRASGRDRTGDLPLTRNTDTPARPTFTEVDGSRGVPVATHGCRRCRHRCRQPYPLFEGNPDPYRRAVHGPRNGSGGGSRSPQPRRARNHPRRSSRPSPSLLFVPVHTPALVRAATRNAAGAKRKRLSVPAGSRLPFEQDRAPNACQVYLASRLGGSWSKVPSRHRDAILRTMLHLLQKTRRATWTSA